MADILIRVTGDTSDIKKNLDEVDQKASATGGHLAEAGKLAAEAWAVANAVAIESVLLYKEQEQATNSLNQAMVQQGIFSSELRDKYLEQAEALEKLTTFDAENIVKAETILQSMIGQTEVTEDLTKATLDFAAAKGISLSTAAELAGKAIGTSTNALGRYGVEVTASATKAEKLTQVIDGLNRISGNRAETDAKGLGALVQLKNATEEVAKVIGEQLAPYVSFAAREMIKFFEEVKKSSSIRGLSTAFVFLTKEMLLFAFDLGTIVQQVAASLGGLAGTVVLLMSGQFKAAKDSFINLGSDVAKIGEDNGKKLEEIYKGLDAADAGRKDSKAEDDLNRVKESAANEGRVKQEESDKAFIAASEQREAQFQAETQQMLANNEYEKLAKTQADIKMYDVRIKSETDFHKKRKLIEEKDALETTEREQLLAKQKTQLQADTFASIATMSSSNNKTLAFIGKAAGITQVAIDTPVAISKALAAFPPPFNFAAATLVGVAMAAQAANIAGVALAEGGIVMPTPGGIQATIGEAGQAEAVIPLDRMSEFGMGGGGGTTQIEISLKDQLVEFIETKIVERRRLGTSLI